VLEKLVLESIRFFYENRCAVIFINKSMLEASGTSDDDTGGFAGIPNSIRGVIIGITIREKENSEFKVSLRSDISIDSSKICRRFGGGGHPCAAGFTISGKLEDVLNKIIKEVGDFI
jgi:phosphoesterase RecJ-like protein